MKKKNQYLLPKVNLSRPHYFFIVVTLLIFFFPRVSTKEFPWDYEVESNFSIKQLRQKLLESPHRWPEELNIGGKDYLIQYTFNQQLSTFILDLLQEFRSDFTSVAVIDNDTGNVLSWIDHGREEGDMGLGLTFSGVHPSASLFKIITSADLLQNTQVKKDSLFNYLGRSTTLFKYQLNGARMGRWMKYETLMQAFARSNNVIFGKAALLNTRKESILQTAQNFGFQQDLLEEYSLPVSKIFIPENNFNLAELATGFNRKTTMTTIHGALLSLIVANRGIFKSPKIVSEVKLKGNEALVWRPYKRSHPVLATEVSDDLQEMMELTVKAGTAKRVYRTFDLRLKNNLKMGGKTGSITGGEPFGKRDWFTVYALPFENSLMKGPQKGISVCVMIINVKKWYVKATYLAKRIIEFYYKSVVPNQR